MKAMMLMNVALVLGAGLCLATGCDTTETASSPAPMTAEAEMEQAERLFRIGAFYCTQAYEAEDDSALTAKIREGIGYLERSAELGHPAAMAALASLYHERETVVPWMDEAKSVEWTKRAWSVAEPKAKAGDVRAQYAMASLCSKAYYGAKDPEERQAKAAEARAWHQKSAEGGYPPAMADFALYPVSDDLKACMEASLQWLTRAAELGHFGAMFSLAEIYSTSVNRDFALERLFFCWRLFGSSEGERPELSMEELLSAAEAGDLDAQFDLCWRYRALADEGEDEEARLESYRWLKRWVATFMEQTGLESNDEEALKWVYKCNDLWREELSKVRQNAP